MEGAPDRTTKYQADSLSLIGAVALGTGGRGQKLLPTMLAAKVERLPISFGMERGGFVHGHSADGVFGRGFRFIHGHVPFQGVVVTVS